MQIRITGEGVKFVAEKEFEIVNLEMKMEEPRFRKDTRLSVKVQNLQRDRGILLVLENYADTLLDFDRFIHYLEHEQSEGFKDDPDFGSLYLGTSDEIEKRVKRLIRRNLIEVVDEDAIDLGPEELVGGSGRVELLRQKREKEQFMADNPDLMRMIYKSDNPEDWGRRAKD